MENYHIRSTDRTPEILIDFTNHNVILKGVCAPENSKLYFEEILSKIKTLLNTKKITTFTFDLEYFNSSSSKKILDILNQIRQSSHSSCHIINWSYDEDDEEILESGEIFEEVSELKFNFKPYKV